MTLRIHAKLEEKLTCGLENDMRNLTNFYQRTQKFQKWDLYGSFCPKKKLYDLKV